MGRILEFCLYVLVLVLCGLLSRAELSESLCSSYAITENSCVCSKTDTDRLLVNCSGHTGPLRREDLLCCTYRENSTTSNEIFTGGGFDPDDIEAIDTVNSDLQEFDFKILSNFTSLLVLNISRSGIVNVTWQNCSLPALKYLDLSYNNMTGLNKDFFMCNRSLSVLGLSGTPWNCELLRWFIDWVRKAETLDLKIPEKNDIVCHYYELLPYKRSAYMWKLIDSCPNNCSCTLLQFDKVEVDCSGRDYYDFPEHVPHNTKSIHMENNAVHSFQRVLTVSSYQNVSQLYLDNNAIESLKELEGIQRHLHLYTLHLAGNRITQLSDYIMEQLEADYIKLGGNPWHCNCEQGTSLLNYIINNHLKIKDIRNIKCAATDTNHANKVVYNLTPTELCVISQMHPLDILNIILASLVFISLINLGWLVWQYKHNGKLPVGPTAYIAQMWKQRRDRLTRHIKITPSASPCSYQAPNHTITVKRKSQLNQHHPTVGPKISVK